MNAERGKSMYDPTQLPEIDQVEVLTLGFEFGEESTLSRLSTGWDGFPIHLATIVVDPRVVTAIADLWRTLPTDEQARCHIPAYGVRFFADNIMILQASICWECNNIWMLIGEERTSYHFNGQSEPAQRLLRLLRYLSGEYLNLDPPDSLSINDYL